MIEAGDAEGAAAKDVDKDEHETGCVDAEEAAALHQEEEEGKPNEGQAGGKGPGESG